MHIKEKELRSRTFLWWTLSFVLIYWSVMPVYVYQSIENKREQILERLENQNSAGPASTVGSDAKTDRATIAETKRLRVCERATQCCLTAYGDKISAGKDSCTTFLSMPSESVCQNAYEAFAKVGNQLGRRCE